MLVVGSKLYCMNNGLGNCDLVCCILDSYSLLLSESGEIKCKVMNPAGAKGPFLMDHFPRYRWEPFGEESCQNQQFCCCGSCCLFLDHKKKKMTLLMSDRLCT